MHWIDGNARRIRSRQAGNVASFTISLVAAVFTLGCFFAASAQQPAPPAATQPPSSPLLASPQSNPPAAQSALPPALQSHPAELQFVVLLDPAHGGSDNGAILGPADPEKNYTLALAVRLHVLLNARGIHSILTRDADTTMDNTARAVAANRAHASACILLHATPTGNGVHLFTSSLPAAPQPDPRRAFLPWRTAQASYGTQSLRLESDVNAALTRQHVPVLLDRTSLMPLDSMACPAVAVEMAPLNADMPLTDSAYQEKVAESLATAIVEWRSDWRMQP